MLKGMGADADINFRSGDHQSVLVDFMSGDIDSMLGRSAVQSKL